MVPKSLPESIEEYHPLLRALKGNANSTDRLRWLCRNDLYFLFRYILRRADAEHPWIFARCREVQASPYGHLDLWSREHFKSSIITLAQGIQDILKTHGDGAEGQEVTTGIFAYSRPAAKKFLRQIKVELEENDQLRHLFPDILYEDPRRQSVKWTDDEGIVVKRRGNPKEATIEAHGLVDGMPTGAHFNKRVYDDVVTQASVTEGMLTKTTEAWELSTALGTDGGVFQYIGTRYADGDTYGVMLERGAAKPRIYPATDDGTAGGRPVLFSEDYWAEKKLNNSPYVLACQFLQNPVPSGEGYFTESMFRDCEAVPAHARIYAASDYAASEGRGDYTVHLVVGLDPDDNLYVVNVWRRQALPNIGVAAQLALQRQHRPVAWATEKSLLDKGVGPFLRDEMRKKNTYIALKPFSTVGDKEMRAQSIIARVNARGLYIPRKAPWAQDFKDELLRFPAGRHDDQVDALSLIGMMLDQMPRGAHPSVAQRYGLAHPVTIKRQLAIMGQRQPGEFE